MVKGERPEHTGPPEFFYNEDEAKKYTNNSRMIEIQVRMDNQPATFCGSCRSLLLVLHARFMAPHICRVIHTQARLTNRAVELLALPEDDTPKLLLDIGCGSGLSGEQLTEMVSCGWES